MTMSGTKAAAIIVLLLSSAEAAIVRADSLGLTPAADVANRSGLLSLPAPIAWGIGITALLMLVTLPWPRPARAAKQNGVTTVEVRPPSASGELGTALRAAIAIVLAACALAARPLPPRASVSSSGSVGAGALAPFQVALPDIAPSLQAMYRDLQRGVLEAEQASTAAGQWPEIATLVAQGTPPFAPSPAHRVAYVWTLRADGAGVSYLGVAPAGSDAPSLLLSILDPSTHPDAPGATHRLSHGPSMRVSVWFRPAGIAAPPPTGVVTRPAAERWMQIVAPDDASAP
jgi:hypothetical protein